MRGVIACVILLLVSGGLASAATIPAASCSFSDVQAAVTAAASGDTVTIPAGTCAWNTTLSIAKGITVQGAGEGTTILQDTVPKGGSGCSGGGPLIAWTVTTPDFFRLTALTIQGVTTDPGVCQRGHVTVGGSSHSFRIDHLTIDPAQTVAIFLSGDLWGLIDHYTFRASFKNAVRVEHLNWNGTSNDAWGDQSWAQALQIGTIAGVYIEDSSFTDTSGSQAVGNSLDCFAGGRVTFRHNTGSQINLTTHGADSDQRHRGCRWTEAYSNTFAFSNVNGLAFLAWIRGGTGVFYSNTITTTPGCAGCPYTNKIVQVVNCRDASAGCGGGPSYPPWGACNGAGSFDQNSNGTGYRCVDQPGSGTSNLLDPDPGGNVTPVQWVGNINDPVYTWNNTLNGVANDTTTGSTNVVNGRDYFTGVARPGYSPLVYPHPLQGGGTPSLQTQGGVLQLCGSALCLR